MNKMYKYTVITVILAVAFSLGSMAAVNLMLQTKEGQLLSENGEIVTGKAVWEWQKQETLTVEQVEAVVSRWKKSMRMTVQNPVSGQISMEEAVKSGKEWLSQMELEEYEWEDERDWETDGYGFKKKETEEIYSLDATLGAMTQERFAKVQQPYDSFWKVQLSNRSLQAFLYVNAVTGRVWKAEVTLYEGLPGMMPYWKLKDFIELSGLQPHHRGAIRNKDETEAVWDVADSRLCAKMKISRADHLNYRERRLGIKFRQEKVKIIMELQTREEN